jgi:hypothetical protein
MTNNETWYRQSRDSLYKHLHSQHIPSIIPTAIHSQSSVTSYKRMFVKFLRKRLCVKILLAAMEMGLFNLLLELLATAQQTSSILEKI